MAEIKVNAGDGLQSAINIAMGGDVITVEAGATFTGPIELPNKSISTEILIQSSRASELPQDRVNPGHAGLMPKILAPHADQALRTQPAAHHYKFVGIEFAPDPAATAMYDLVRLGGTNETQTTLDSVPHHLTIDRCYVHGLAGKDAQRGISLNSAETTVSNCYISEIHGQGYDTQAIAGWNGPGPFHIINNYLEGAGENILFGGADPAIPHLVPSDIEIRRNYVFKPLIWKVDDPSYAGKHWTIKNLLELKNAKNVVIDGNVFENNWTDAQSGMPILFTVRNQDGTAPWSIIENVTFSNNTVKNAEGALSLLGSDYVHPSQRSSGLHVINNLFVEIRGAFMVINGFFDVTLDRNTSLQTNNLMTLTVEASPGLRFTNHLTNDHDYGIFGDGGLVGVNALNKWAPGWVMTGGVIAHPYDRGSYPDGNQYPADPIQLPPDYRSPYPGVGCDIDALLAAQSGASVSVPLPTPDPTPTPLPTPIPVPLPTPTPPPVACSISAPSSVSIPKWSSGKIVVTLNNMSAPVTVTVSGSSGQVTVSPLSKTVSGTSAVLEFGVKVKQQSRTITFDSPCGRVNVRVNAV